MQIIISNPNIGQLLKFADDMLKKHGRDTVPDNIKGQAALSSIKHMFGGTYFSICDVDRLAEVDHVRISSEHHAFMSSLHCVHFADMTIETREYLFALMVDYFRSNIAMSYATGVSN